MLKGQKEYEKFKKGQLLTFRQAIIAQCYICNGESEGGEDCLGVNCPLYQYMPYQKGRKKKELSVEQRSEIGERLKRGRRQLILPSGTQNLKEQTALKQELKSPGTSLSLIKGGGCEEIDCPF